MFRIAVLCTTLVNLNLPSAHLVKHNHSRCPEVTWPVLEAACTADSCQGTADCADDSLCCHNGCVKSCIRPPDPPFFFDWSEEMPQPDYIQGEKNGLEGDVVRLAGGCVLDRDQYLRLQDFRNNENIIDCYCRQGSVVCKVADREEHKTRHHGHQLASHLINSNEE